MANIKEQMLSQTLDELNNVWFKHDEKLYHIWASDDGFQYDELSPNEDNYYISYETLDGGLIETYNPLTAIEYITQG